MNTIDAGPGVCIGYGATNARFADVARDTVKNFHTTETPQDPNEFFRQMAGWVIGASEAGNLWMVAGFPGPVSPGGKIVGPLSNVQGMAEKEYAIEDELEKAQPGIRKILDQELELICVNDGDLAAQAVAARDRDPQKGEDKVAALIIGTGVGLGVVEKDPKYVNVYRSDNTQPYELGHNTIDIRPDARYDEQVLTWEKLLAGPALARRYGVKSLLDLKLKGGKNPTDRAEFQAYDILAKGIVTMATNLGTTHGVQLVVPTGGVGAGAVDGYRQQFDQYLKIWRRGKDAVQANNEPRIHLVGAELADQYEMYGAVGIMRARKTESGLHLPLLFNTGKPITEGFHDN